MYLFAITLCAHFLYVFWEKRFVWAAEYGRKWLWESIVVYLQMFFFSSYTSHAFNSEQWTLWWRCEVSTKHYCHWLHFNAPSNIWKRSKKKLLKEIWKKVLWWDWKENFYSVNHRVVSVRNGDDDEGIRNQFHLTEWQFYFKSGVKFFHVYE